jgi:hypothetical protein
MQTMNFEPGDRVIAQRLKKSRVRRGTIVRLNPDGTRAFIRWADRMGWMSIGYLKLETPEN